MWQTPSMVSDDPSESSRRIGIQTGSECVHYSTPTQRPDWDALLGFRVIG